MKNRGLLQHWISQHVPGENRKSSAAIPNGYQAPTESVMIYWHHIYFTSSITVSILLVIPLLHKFAHAHWVSVLQITVLGVTNTTVFEASITARATQTKNGIKSKQNRRTAGREIVGCNHDEGVGTFTTTTTTTTNCSWVFTRWQ